jgi:hypothetical protein
MQFFSVSKGLSANGRLATYWVCDITEYPVKIKKRVIVLCTLSHFSIFEYMLYV